MNEAPLERTEHGLTVAGDGWFVVNAADVAWYQHDRFGAGAQFEGRTDFPQLGIRLRALWPGQSNGLYHSENAQEDFLVLAGECLLLVEGQERRLRAWDFVHCPPRSAHVFVGAGDGPCVIMMVGARLPDGDIGYPVSELALKHGAGVEQEARDPRDAYADLPSQHYERPPELGLPWQ